MKEELLHYVWRTGQFSQCDLRTVSGENVLILDRGRQNIFSGPDFLNAQIQIGDQLWAGNVEIHIRSSDWKKHAHDDDPAYDNVILHVVWEDDDPVRRTDGSLLHSCELKERIPKELIEYLSIIARPAGKPACAGVNAGEFGMETEQMISRSLTDRLRRKTAEIDSMLRHCNGDWEDMFYRVLLTSFGMQQNADPFRWLANVVPLRLVMRYRNDLAEMEALLFGQAGLLEGEEGPYAKRLQVEYAHMSRLHELEPLSGHAWKFMRLRPVNFPTVRIAQAAALFHAHEKLFRLCMENDDVAVLEKIFNVRASSFWDDHYRFNTSSGHFVKHAGKRMIEHLLINAVVPVKFLYARRRGDEHAVQQALEMLASVPAEDNAVVHAFRENGWSADDAFHSQGLLELKRNFCDRKKCLSCEVGMRILGRKMMRKEISMPVSIGNPVARSSDPGEANA